MTGRDIELLRTGAERFGISLDDSAVDRFAQYAALLETGSRETNLVSKNDLGRLVTYHFLDSLKIASCVPIGRHARILDFGSGAGFPGIPLAIAFPESSVYLVESRTKRCAFLESSIAALGLSQCTVCCSRVERLDETHTGAFDLVVTRGTVKLDAYVSLAERFIRPGGSLVAIKGEHIETEYRHLATSVSGEVFNILQTRPTPFDGVRDGWVVLMTRRELSTE